MEPIFPQTEESKKKTDWDWHEILERDPDRNRHVIFDIHTLTEIEINNSVLLPSPPFFQIQYMSSGYKQQQTISLLQPQGCPEVRLTLSLHFFCLVNHEKLDLSLHLQYCSSHFSLQVPSQFPLISLLNHSKLSRSKTQCTQPPQYYWLLNCTFLAHGYFSI